MYYSRKRPIADFPTESTLVWSCTNEACNGWIRAGYSFDDIPTCTQCNAPMAQSTKMLPILMDSSHDLKNALKKLETKNT